MNITTHCYSAPDRPAPIQSLFPDAASPCGLPLRLKVKHHHCTSLVALEMIGTALERRDPELLPHMLSPEEQVYFERFSYPKRRREWLGGRIAAKTAMLKFTGSEWMQDEFRQLTILPDEHGRPTADRMPEVSLSISHSSGFAVAMASSLPSCGIDLQRISPKLSRLTDRFAAESELRIITGLTSPDNLPAGLTMLWSAKEALKKSMLHDQPAVFNGIRLKRATVVGGHELLFLCTVQGRPDQTVTIHDVSPYILALTGIQSHA